jgi:GT2 family glycosyltransferase
VILKPPMAPKNTPEADAVWVGELDVRALAALPEGERIQLAGGEQYRSAKIMLRDQRDMLGFVLTDVQDGLLPVTFPSHALVKPRPTPAPVCPEKLPFFTVAICSHERPDDLRDALRSVYEIDYPNFEVLVVDNAPKSERTRRMLTEEYPEVKYVREMRQGVSQARNAAIANAKGEFIAFTDDDVIVDPYWLRAYAATFLANEQVACVTGLVPSGELATKTQRYFDSRVTWGDNAEHRVYRLGENYPDLPAFPFSVGAYGTGANFAMRRSLALTFDEALGAGRPTGGGEDIDFFFRVLQARHGLAMSPDAIVWHRHRATEDALLSQTRTYGIGLGAWLTKLVLTPAVWPQIAAKALAGANRFRRLGGENTVQDERLLPVDANLDRAMRSLEKRAILSGFPLYLRERVKGAVSA